MKHFFFKWEKYEKYACYFLHAIPVNVYIYAHTQVSELSILMEFFSNIVIVALKLNNHIDVLRGNIKLEYKDRMD